MPKLRLTRRHNTTQASALDVLERQIPIMLDRFSSNVSNPQWQRRSEAITFSGKSPAGVVKGTIQVEQANMKLDVDIPWAARPFKGRIEREIHSWIDEIFGPEP